MSPLVTTAAGGKITGVLALTFEAAVSLPVGAPVEMDGDYHVKLATGNALVVGHVDVPNVRRTGGTFPSPWTPGVVTVEARGYSVRKMLCSGTVTAGDGVRFNGTAIVTDTTPFDAGFVGIALTGGTNTNVDVLVH